ncbi:MAG: putative negative regulator of RcsB-dependent stress response [Pseudohongiellaceae bacterium]
MADHLSDQEQLQVIKNWWTQNGRYLLICIAVSVSAYLSWQWWTASQQQHAEQASAIYSELVASVVTSSVEPLSSDELTTATFLVEQLKNDFSDTAYAVNAALLQAKLDVDQGDLERAVDALNFAIDNGNSDIQVVATHRLARVYLAQKNMNEALVLASYDKNDAFASKYADLRGDIYSAKGDIAAAVAAYRQALSDMEDGDGIQRNLIEIKLADLSASGE